MVDEPKNSFPGEENTLHNSWPDQDTLQEVGVCVSSQQSREDFTRVNIEGSPRCKPLVSLKNRKARLEFAKRHLKKPSQFWNNILWTDETKINCTRVMGREEYGEGKELLMILSIPPHQ